ncbi:GNAT family N-acetyltransferase, partial [bacterium]|nr:GNAT family N-acetyltransferase [bacterium]
AELYVKPAYRRQKIADRLLKEAETYTRSLGINRIEMAVLHENVNAHAVFQAKGYRESVHILSKEL